MGLHKAPDRGTGPRLRGFDLGGRMSDAETLTRQLGGDWRGFRGSAPCPACQPERRADQRALSLRHEGGRLLAFCHKQGCSFRTILDAAGLPAEALTLDTQAQRDADPKRATYDAEQMAKAARLWALARPIRGSKGEAYLRGRGITCPLPEALRWAAEAYHGPSARFLPAMVARVTTGAVHRTFFDRSGARLCGNAKMMLGACAGGAVPLVQGAGPLVVAEGIETALSLACGLLPGPATIWAALSASGMAALDLPAQPSCLIVASDGDEAGRRAAFRLADRAAALGWNVSTLAAPDGCDWNDVLMKKGVSK